MSENWVKRVGDRLTHIFWLQERVDRDFGDGGVLAAGGEVAFEAGAEVAHEVDGSRD